MVADVLHYAAKQLLRLSSRSAETRDALLMATGLGFSDALREVFPDRDFDQGFISFVQDSISTDLTYAKCVMYGVNPVKVRESGVMPANPYRFREWDDKEYRLSDPLQLASFFAVYGMRDEAMLLIEERQRYLEAFQEWEEKERPNYFRPSSFGGASLSSFGKYIQAYSLARTWVPPDFEELGLPRVEMHEMLDSLFLEGAFTPESYYPIMRKITTPQNIDKLARISGLKNKRLHPELRKVAYQQAYSLCTSSKGGGFRYEDMITYVRLCTKDQAVKLFEELRGTRQILALVRPDTPSPLYKMGLRQLAQVADSTRNELLPYLGRGPTIEEIRSVKAIGIIHILYYMPWELLAPIANEPGLRAVALPYAEKLGPKVLRTFLVDHEERVKRIPDIEYEARAAAQALPVAGVTSIADWEYVMSQLHRAYTTSIQVRTAINAVTEDPWVSFLALLDPHGASSPHIREMLSRHPRWCDIKRALENYHPPDTTKPWA